MLDRTVLLLFLVVPQKWTLGKSWLILFTMILLSTCMLKILQYWCCLPFRQLRVSWISFLKRKICLMNLCILEAAQVCSLPSAFMNLYGGDPQDSCRPPLFLQSANSFPLNDQHEKILWGTFFGLYMVLSSFFFQFLCQQSVCSYWKPWG